MWRSANPRTKPRWMLFWSSVTLLSIVCAAGSSALVLAKGKTRPNSQRPNLPGPPPLVSPADGSRTCNPAPAFVWKSVRQATFYQIQIDDDPSFASPIVDQVTEQTFLFLSSDLGEGTWHWRVRAGNEDLTGFWSAAWSVRIVGPPGVPSLLSPLDGSLNCGGTPLLEWSTVDDATSYHVQVDDDPRFGSPVLDVSTSDSSYAVSKALAPGIYYWRVQAENECGYGSWSVVYSFVVLVPPSVPVLLTPPNESITKERAPTFSWSEVSGAVYYRIQIDYGLGFDSPLIDEETVAPLFVPASGLVNGTYYWRVLAATACEWGEWSDPWSVTVKNEAPIANDDRFEVDEDSPDRSLDVLDNDRDPDGDTLQIIRVTQPLHGSASIADSRAFLIYRPDPDYFGQDSLTYTVDDGYGGTDTARVELIVIGVNDPPVADAGPDQSVPTSVLVTLDGSRSHDPEGNLPLSYFWTQSGGPPVALSSGIVVSPTFFAPGEPGTLTFELMVMDALGETSAAPDQTVIVVYEPPVYYAYLPSLGRDQIVAPDLIVQRIEATQSDLRVVIANQGNAPVMDGFFVDLYINPRSAPKAVNQTWDQLGDQGLVWGVTGAALLSLEPGSSVTLEVGDLYYIENLSSFSGSLPSGTAIYAQVDSFNPVTTVGTVLEGHEIDGGAYNNVHGPVYSTAAVSGGAMPHARSGSYFR